MNENTNTITLNDFGLVDSENMTIRELTRTSNRIYNKMNAYVENCEQGNHSSIFDHIMLNMFLMKDDITDDGDVIYMLNMFNEIISLSHTIAKVK